MRRTLATLLAWVAATAVLGVLAVGVGESLSPSVLVAPNTESARAQKLAEERFGPSQLMPVLLQGPSIELRRQGPVLSAALAKQPHTKVLSPWNAPPGTEGLRPNPKAAMLIVSVERSEKRAIEVEQPQIERIVAQKTAAPVHASITGQPSVDTALRDQALSAAETYGLIAAGVLFLLLLAGLRSLPGALLVEALAAGSAVGSLGLLRLAGERISVDPLAVPLAVLSGLAVGAAWSLIVLDRRHRNADGGILQGVLIAGALLILALLLTAALAPTKLLVSLGIGIVFSGLTGLLAALVALPGAIALLQASPLERLTFNGLPLPRPLARLSQRLAHMAGAASVAVAGRGDRGARRSFPDREQGAGRRTRPTGQRLVLGLLATLALVALALPVLGLESGQPGIKQLPASNKARLAFERVAKVMGPGWPTPYQVVVAQGDGPITTSSTLAALQGFQRRIALTPSVASVSGPGAISEQTKPLKKLPGALEESGKLLSGGKRDLGRLLSGLGEAGAGAQQLQGGLQTAAGGAQQLHSGSGAALAGSAQLHAGLIAAREGSQTLQAGLQQALQGAEALKGGATQALAGSIDLVNGVGSIGTPVTASVPSTERLAQLTKETSVGIGSAEERSQSAQGDLAAAISDLQSLNGEVNDPRTVEALASVQSAANAVTSISGELGKIGPGAGEAAESASTLAIQTSFLNAALQQLGTGASKLSSGLAQLRAGNGELEIGLGKLAAGGGQLTSGLTKLSDGAGELEAGLGLLTSGSGELAAGLSGGVAPVGELVAGLGLLQAGVSKFSGQLPSPKDLEELQRQSPGLFESGYFLLAAVQGAPQNSKNAASFTLNIDKGGNAGLIAVISTKPSGTEKSDAVGQSLVSQGKSFAKATKLQVAVGGPAGNLRDLTNAAQSSIPWVILAIALASMLLLGLALRAVLIAILAVLAQLLATAATFGLLTALFSVSPPPLRGPGYIDQVSILGIFSIAFGLGVLFTVLPLASIRHLLHRLPHTEIVGTDLAVSQALRTTAAANVGAAALMLGVVIPFATSELITLRQLAVGAALGIVLSAVIVRPLILPAILRLVGRAGWWPGCTQLRIVTAHRATTGDGKPAPMEGEVTQPTVTLVHRVLARRGRDKE